MSFLTQEAFERGNADRMGSFLTQEAFNRADAEKISGMGCPCGTLNDLGCTGCGGTCKGMGDLGADPAPAAPNPFANIPALQPYQAEVTQISGMVSPWLWILSIFGFGMALLNTKRVDSMWKRYGGSKFKGLKKPTF
jgi:hypothetical protein